MTGWEAIGNPANTTAGEPMLHLAEMLLQLKDRISRLEESYQQQAQMAYHALSQAAQFEEKFENLNMRLSAIEERVLEKK